MAGLRWAGRLGEEGLGWERASRARAAAAACTRAPAAAAAADGAGSRSERLRCAPLRGAPAGATAATAMSFEPRLRELLKRGPRDGRGALTKERSDADGERKVRSGRPGGATAAG